jgi:hypothetical protein
MRVTILVTRAATLIKQRRIVSNWASARTRTPLNRVCVPADAARVKRGPEPQPFTNKERRGKNRCNSAHAELTENRLGFKSLAIVVGREGGISVISHYHSSNLDLLDSEPRPVCITKPSREQH